MRSRRLWVLALLSPPLLLACSACRTTSGTVASPVTEDSGSQSAAPSPTLTDTSWQPDGSGGRLEDSSTGFSLGLPSDWTWIRGDGAVLFEARGPDALPVRLELLHWDRDGEQGELRSREEVLVFVARGPHGGLERLADEPPVVLTREGTGDGAMLLSWIFAVEGQGLRLNARLPVRDFERAWRAVDTIVRSSDIPERRADR